jgi:hypothetical protein
MKMNDIDGLLRFGGLALALMAGACADAEPGDEGDEGPAGGKGDDASDDHIGGANPVAIWLKTGAQWNEDKSTFTIAPDVCFKNGTEGPAFAPGKCEDVTDEAFEGGTTIATTGLPYLDMLRQISHMQGCADDGIDSYIISDQLVSEGEASFPRVVNTLCSKDTKNRQNAFFALSFANEDGTDVSTTSLEMFGWEPVEERYRFYKSEGDEDARTLEIEPQECTDCHLTPKALDSTGMAMTPIMNELERPWEHWHSDTNFNFTLPEHLDFTKDDSESFQAKMGEDAPAFALLATPWGKIEGQADPILKSARVLEATITSGYDRVARARVEKSRDATREASVGEAMGLLRPIFCDEQVNYVSQDSEQVVRSAIVPNAIEERLRGLKVQPALDWFLSDAMTLPSDRQMDKLRMIPARGHAPQAVEDRLMVRRMLSAADDRNDANLRGLQAHAVDFEHTVLSDFRCGLWKNAFARLERDIGSNAKTVSLTTGDDLSLAGKTTGALLPRLYEEVMTLESGDFGFDLDAPVVLVPKDGQIVVIRTPDKAAIELLAKGDVPACGDDETVAICLAKPELFAEMIETMWDDIETRGVEAFDELRNERLCHIEDKEFGAVPDFGPAPNCGATGE